MKLSDTLAKIEGELSAIWAPDESGQTKPHATTLNLIAVLGKKDSKFIDHMYDVAARLGARMFLVSVDPRLEGWALDGEVSAVCSVEPGSQRETACAERVELRFGAMVAKRASSILEALVEASLPSVLVVGPGAHNAVVDSLAPAATCTVFDSSSSGVPRTTEIARATRGRIDDLAFMSIRRWREMAARFFDDPRHRGAILEIERVSVRHARREDHAGASAEAELMVAWLGARLGWRADAATLRDSRGRPIQIEIAEVARENVLPGALIALEIHAALEGEAFLGRVVRETDGEHLSWELKSGDTRSTRRFATPRRDDAELVERAIRSALSETLLRETLEFARRWRAGE